MDSNEVVERLTEQVRRAVRNYIAPLSSGKSNDDLLGAALLSGALLVCEYLIKSDGSKSVNVHVLQKAIVQVGTEMKFKMGKMQ